MPAQTCFDGQRVMLPEMHRCSPTNGLLGGKDDGVTSIYLGPVNHPRPSRVLCIFGNMQMNLLTSSFPARHHTLYECSSHFLPATFELTKFLKARLLCLLASVLSREACERSKSRLCGPSLTALVHELESGISPNVNSCCSSVSRPRAVIVRIEGKYRATGISFCGLLASASWML